MPTSRVHPKETIPVVDTIECLTRSHPRKVEPLVALRMRDQLHQYLTVTPYQASQWYLPKALLSLWTTPFTSLVVPVLDTETGEYLAQRHLHHHTKYKNIWEESYCNELECLCQGVGKCNKGPKKNRVAGTEKFCIIRYEAVPVDKRRKATYKKVMYKVYHPKE